jgi:hypothetical protein
VVNGGIDELRQPLARRFYFGVSPCAPPACSSPRAERFYPFQDMKQLLSD